LSTLKPALPIAAAAECPVASIAGTPADQDVEPGVTAHGDQLAGV
jgi:hypothetical protein